MRIEHNVLLDVAESDIGKNGSFSIPKSVTTIGNSAFYGCESLKEITIPNGVTAIGSSVFCGCESLRKITIPESVTTIGSYAFFECESLEKITIPNGVTTIGSFAFCKCESLKEITIPDGVTAIGSFAFYGCESLKEITILNGMASINDYAFENCENLRQIAFAGQTYPVKCVDESCMRVLHKKQMKDITILKCMYFPNMDKTVYIAEKNGYTAHGETIRNAVEDLQFKMLENVNLEEHIQRIKQQGYMNANDYRLLTGACREGTNHFLQEHGLTWEDTMSVEQVLEITKGQYGFERFQRAAKQILQDQLKKEMPFGISFFTMFLFIFTMKNKRGGIQI